ncbi:hypothetical protein [Nocardioides montaniterrae]
MNTNLRTTVLLAAAAAVLSPIAIGGSASAAPSTPRGILVSAKAALPGWHCGPIADEKFACDGFSVNVRSIDSLPKWRQEDPDQVAYVTKRWFVTVQPADLSAADFAAVKHAVARGRG